VDLRSSDPRVALSPATNFAAAGVAHQPLTTDGLWAQSGPFDQIAAGSLHVNVGKVFHLDEIAQAIVSWTRTGPTEHRRADLAV
jgi:hypothetical protein